MPSEQPSSGSSNGFEVCRRTRALAKKDFIRLA
jgi:hypothetical protein